MISEINGKISSSGNNLSDRLEDKLTGDFFGAVRYLPFETGMKHVLSPTQYAQGGSGAAWGKLLHSCTGYSYDLKFWVRYDQGEIDLLLQHPEMLVGIEV